jgi:hypothetical protein
MLFAVDTLYPYVACGFPEILVRQQALLCGHRLREPSLTVLCAYAVLSDMEISVFPGKRETPGNIRRSHEQRFTQSTLAQYVLELTVALALVEITEVTRRYHPVIFMKRKTLITSTHGITLFTEEE